MFSLERPNRLLHGGKIHFVMHMPGEAPMKSRREWMVPDLVHIEPAPAVPSGIEGVGNYFDLFYDDVGRGQGIQPLLQPPRLYLPRNKKVGYLTQCMNPRVRSAGSVKSSPNSQDCFEPLFQNLLDGRPVRLDLPAVIVGPVILDSELDVHKLEVARLEVSFRADAIHPSYAL